MRVPTVRCEQCDEPMSAMEFYVLGPVCGPCCKSNHREVLGLGSRRRKRAPKRPTAAKTALARKERGEMWERAKANGRAHNPKAPETT